MRLSPYFLSLGCLIGLGLTCVGLPVVGAPLRIRGAPQIQALRTEPAVDEYRVVGYLRNASGQGLAGQRVQITAAEARPCTNGEDVTGPDGEFCFLVRSAAGSRIELLVEETEFHLETRLQTQLHPQPAQLNLQLLLGHKEFDLAAAPYPLQVELETAGNQQESYPLRVELLRQAEEPERLWAESSSLSAQRLARFQIEPTLPTRPGLALLRATVSAGSKDIATAEQTVLLFDSATLSLSSPLEPIRPSSGFELRVSVSGQNGLLPSGQVEAWLGEIALGNAAVESGEAVLALRFQAPRPEQLLLTLRYVPTEPWYRAGPALDVELRVLPPRWWSQLPWFFLAAAATYWIVRTWRRPGRDRTLADPKPPQEGNPEVVLLRTAPDSDAWSGHLIDAHTGEAVPLASIQIEVPSIGAPEVKVSTQTGKLGEFRLPFVAALPEGARLVVRAENYSELRQNVPLLGELRVCVVARRRTVLGALVAWTERMGTPWSTKPPATPAEVRRVAQREKQKYAYEWADDVEQAAFGPATPDATTEHDLLSRIPPLDRPGKLSR